MTDMRTTRAGLIVVGGVVTDLRTTRAGLIVVYSETAVPPTVTAPANVLARGGAAYADSFLEYDGRNAGAADGVFPGVTMLLSGGTTWLPGETLTLTASNFAFVVGDVGNVIILHSAAGEKIRFTIGAFSSSVVVTGITDVSVPTAMRSASVVVWDRAVDEITGLDHLEAANVSILGDDHVIASPNNARLAIVTVADGTVALGDFYSRVIVGLPYFSDLETLDIDKPAGSSAKSQKIAVESVGLMLLQSRQMFVGARPPVNDAVDPLENLQEMPLPTDQDYESLITDFKDAKVKSKWNNNGRAFVRSVDPVPLTVLAIIPNGYLP